MSADLTILSAQQALGVGIAWPDVYFSPGYGLACEASDGAAWRVAVWRGGRILQPYLERRVDGAPDRFDIVSPYGYAGAWGADSATAEDWVAFRAALRATVREQGGVAEFLRLSGLLPGREALAAADPALCIADHHDTLLISLEGGEDAVFARYEGRARTKTRKALKLGYVGAARDASAADLAPGSEFRRLYAATMEGLDATAYYRFCDAYFERLAQQLADVLFYAEIRDPSGAVASAGIGFRWGSTLHLHLVGSDRDALRDGVGNLLYDTVLRYGVRVGCVRAHVGGGMSEGDALFKFKRSFGGVGVPFQLGRAIFDADAVARLTEARATATGRTAAELVASGYFPPYRA